MLVFLSAKKPLFLSILMTTDLDFVTEDEVRLLGFLVYLLNNFEGCIWSLKHVRVRFEEDMLENMKLFDSPHQRHHIDE